MPATALPFPMFQGEKAETAMSLCVAMFDDGAIEAIDRLLAGPGGDGRLLMPPGDCGFSRKFARLNDRFGVSRQLDLA